MVSSTGAFFLFDFLAFLPVSAATMLDCLDSSGSTMTDTSTEGGSYSCNTTMSSSSLLRWSLAGLTSLINFGEFANLIILSTSFLTWAALVASLKF